MDKQQLSDLKYIEIQVRIFGGDSRLKTCQGIQLVIDHENLESEDSIKYLGVVIHKNLTWNEHIWAYRIINGES